MDIYFNRLIIKNLITKNSFSNFTFKPFEDNLISITGVSKRLFICEYLKILLESIPVYIYDVKNLMSKLENWNKLNELSIDLSNFKIVNSSRELVYLEFLYNLEKQNSNNLILSFSKKFNNRNVFLIISFIICIFYSIYYILKYK